MKLKKFILRFTNEGQELNYEETIEDLYKEEAKVIAEKKVEALQAIMVQGDIGCTVLNDKYHEIYIVEGLSV